MKKTKTLKRVIPALLVLAGCLAAKVPVYGQALKSTPGSATPSTVMEELFKFETWMFLFTILISGALGGFVYELLTLSGGLERPHWLTQEEIDKNKGFQDQRKLGKFILNLGFISPIIIGALAALASLLFLSPINTIQLIATGVITGSIGTSIFRSMQDRIIAMLAVEVADKAKEREAETKRIAGEADQRVTEAIKSKSSGRKSESMGSPKSEEPDPVVKLLEEAHALYQSIQRK